MSQVLDALDHAHEAGVVHRDIKPANIIMARNGKLKVADFGIARIEDTNLTQANVMIGTPSYMAPEQFLGTKMDRRVDLYSAGVLLYLLLTGKPPFTGTQEQLMYKVVHEAPPLPSQVDGANRPRFYDAIIQRALAKDPAQRFASAAEFKAAIERGVGEPFDTTVWEQTLIGVAERMPPAAPAAPAAASRSGTTPPGTATGSGTQGSWISVPDHWDRAVLKEAEASLAKHVGPLASVLVRRAARECTDLPSLYARLAEQVTDPRSRTAFLDRATSITAIRPGSSATAVAAAGTAAASSSGGAPLNDALLEAATRLMAQHVGPIAKVMVRKAAGRTQDRAVFFGLLAEAVPEGPARHKLLAELQQLN
jgi:serine/threonine-protein kinase